MRWSIISAVPSSCPEESQEFQAPLGAYFPLPLAPEIWHIPALPYQIKGGGVINRKIYFKIYLL